MRNKRGLILVIMGLCFLIAASGLTVSNRLEERHGEQMAKKAELILKKDVIPQLTEDEEGYSTTATQMQTAEIDGDEYIGVIDIPSLELSLPVISKWDDELLKKAPCRYSGSFLDDSMIIAGHNYRKHFSGIKNMHQGEIIRFTDVNGSVYNYAVEELVKIPGTDIAGMEDGEWDLTLFTCSYGGKDRIAVRCTRTVK